jgi:hypothetical protein
MNDQISRQKLIEELNSYHYTAIGMRCGKKITAEIIKGYHDHVIEVIESQPPADQWIPVTYHEATEEEKELYGDEQPYILDCPLPEEDDRILVCTQKGYVFEAVAHCDGGWFLDNGEDFVELAAWMPLPEPYKGVE